MQKSILKALLYFDMFDHPIQLSELLRFLSMGVVSTSDLREACDELAADGEIEERGGCYALKERSENIVKKRWEKEKRALTMWKIAGFMAGIIRRFPYVRAVFVTGELSKGVASRNSDIDFFIVTAPRRVWIVRTLCAAFKIVFLFNRKKFFCYNHIASETHLAIPQTNFYTAVEVVTTKPLYNAAMFGRFLEANSWTGHYLPNAGVFGRGISSTDYSKPFAEQCLDAVFPPEAIDRVDQWLLIRWRDIWDRRYPHLSPEKREQLFRSEPGVSTAYAGDYLDAILLNYQRRLWQHGLASVAQQ